MENMSISEIVAAAVAALVGGAATWKALPLILGKLTAAIGNAHAEKDMIERLSKQLDKAELRAEAAEKWANEAFKERNLLLEKFGDVKAELAKMTERVDMQSDIIEKQSKTIEQQANSIRSMEQDLKRLRESIA